MPNSGIDGSYDSFIPSFFWESAYCSPQWLYQFTFPPKVQEGYLSPYLLQHLLFIDFFFIITILTSMWWYFIAVLIDISLIMSSVEASYHVFIGHLYVFFAEVSVYVFCLFF